MKVLRIFLASLSIFAGAQMASAQTTIRITGSVAYRAAVHTAILNILDPGFTVGWVGGSLPTWEQALNRAPEAIFKGTVHGVNNVIIKTAWSGSLAGLYTVTTGRGMPDPNATPPITAGFLVDSTPTSPLPGTSNVPATFEYVYTPAGLDQPGFPNVVLSDSFQSSTPYKTPVLGITPTGEKVGVVPFVWVKNAGAPAGLSNMTNQLATGLQTNGSLPLSRWTCNAGDLGIPVYTMDSNDNSGTRLDAFAEAGFGIASPPAAIDPTQANADHIDYGTWVSGPGGVVFFPPAWGVSNDGQLAGFMNATGSFGVLGGYILTFLGINDANTVNAGLNNLTYNGVAYNAAAVQQGQYTFWAYEHFYLAPTFTGVPAGNPHRTVANAIAAQLTYPDAATSGILLNTMKVSRFPAEGAPVF
jgi:hypothetical protein